MVFEGGGKMARKSSPENAGVARVANAEASGGDISSL